MTQEELDAMMNGDIDDIDVEEEESSSEPLDAQDSDKYDDAPKGYNKETSHQWPLPATDENKMVHQLDDVTKESEEKASEIFDIIEEISNSLMEKEETLASITQTLNSNIELFKTLTAKFPEVDTFASQLEQNEFALKNAEDAVETLQTSGDSIMNVMDIMQYQDIHRQKIERVINVMRALSKYMSTLFESSVKDEDRVSSAQHIAGDTHNDLASTDDIESLLEQFGN